jgi:hypothetical protein
MKINGLMKKARWENIPCQCGKDVMDSYPIKDCLHCKFQECWESVPHKDFQVNDDQYDKNRKLVKKQTRTVKELWLVRGSKFQDVIGWNF